MDLFIRKCNFSVSLEALTAVLAKFKHAELHYAPANEIMNVPIGTDAYLMDLRTCPQEMLASVLKYTTFETVTRIRKINKQMDYVSVKYSCNLPRIYKVSLRRYDHSDAKIDVEYVMEEIWDTNRSNGLFSTLTPRLTYDQSTILTVFEQFIKKMYPTDFMSFLHGEIDQHLVDVLVKMKLSRRLSIEFNNCNFAVPVENITSVLSKYPNSEMRIESVNRIMNEPMDTDATIIALLPYASVYYGCQTNNGHRPAFTDETLRVARQCQPRAFQVGCYCPFSVPEIKKTMLHLIDCSKRKDDEIIQWSFGNLQMGSLEEIKSAVKELLAIPGVNSNWHGNASYIWYYYGFHVVLFNVYLMIR